MRFDRGTIRKIRGWGVFLAFCAAAAVAMRAFVVEGYNIPTGSMEPVLHGDPADGDRVAVFKPCYDLVDPQRFDLVVVSVDRGEGSGAVEMVKRVAGFPGESILIREDGDLYLGETPPARLKKTLPQILSLLIPVYRARFDAGFLDQWESFASVGGELRIDPAAKDKGWRVDNQGLLCRGTVPAFQDTGLSLTFGTEVTDGYLDHCGAYVPGSFTVRDVSLTLEVTVLDGDAGAVRGSVREGGDEFTFELASAGGGGGGRLVRSDGTQVAIGPGLFPGFERGRSHAVQILNVDNQVFLLVDGKQLALIDYSENRTAASVSIYNSPSFGAKGLDALFTAVAIDRDLHYTPTGRWAVQAPYPVPRGTYFLLGDNSSLSEDSRHFGAQDAGRIRGRPFLVFYPFSRLRFL